MTPQQDKYTIGVFGLLAIGWLAALVLAGVIAVVFK